MGADTAACVEVPAGRWIAHPRPHSEADRAILTNSSPAGISLLGLEIASERVGFLIGSSVLVVIGICPHCAGSRTVGSRAHCVTVDKS